MVSPPPPWYSGGMAIDAHEFGMLMDRAVSSAKSNAADDLPPGALRHLWRSHEIVVACWPGSMGRGAGYYRMVLKGGGAARAAVLAGQTLKTPIAGILCRDYAHAAAIRQMVESPVELSIVTDPDYDGPNAAA
jgi:hypothetical protein